MGKIKKILQVIVPIALAVFLFWYMYKDLPLDAVKDVFKNGVNYKWISLSIIMSCLSVIIRGLRWNQLTAVAAPGGRKRVTILAVFIAYLGNLIFPRAGEVMRCGILKNKDGLSFTKTLGTVFTERVCDMISLIIIAVITVFIQLGFFEKFFSENPDSLGKLTNLLTNKILWLLFVIFIAFFFVIKRYIKKFKFYDFLKKELLKFWDGIKSIKSVNNPYLFILYTFIIWLLYFLMFYIGKYFFYFDIPLGVAAMMGGLVMGSLGFVAPTQGGIGAYHFMVIYTLVFYGIPEVHAQIFALFVHGLQTLIMIITGIISYIWLYFIDKKGATEE